MIIKFTFTIIYTYFIFYKSVEIFKSKYNTLQDIYHNVFDLYHYTFSEKINIQYIMKIINTIKHFKVIFY